MHNAYLFILRQMSKALSTINIKSALGTLVLFDLNSTQEFTRVQAYIQRPRLAEYYA